MAWDDPIIILIAAIAALLFLTMWGAILLPHIPVHTVKQMIVGVKAPPLLVAAVRRLLTALGALAVGSLQAWLMGFEAGQFAAVAAAAGGVIEAGWGIMDQMLKSDQNAVNPPPVAGSGGGDPSSG